MTANSPNPCEIDVDFGVVAIGQADTAVIQIENRGDGVLDLSQLNLRLDVEFSLDYPTPQPIEPGTSGQFSVTFEPSKTAAVSSMFTIKTDGVNPACPPSENYSVITVVMAGSGAGAK